MTVLVGIKCRDGIVIGSDSSATFTAAGPESRTIEQPTKKIEILREKYIVAGTGAIGLGQRFCWAVEQATKQNALANKHPTEAAVSITQLALKDFMSTQVRTGQYGALVAFPVNAGLQLAEYGLADLQPELKTDKLWYGSMGSGQTIADPFLGLIRATFWSEGMPNLQDGIFAAVWTLQHCIDLNPGGVKGPIEIATLTAGDDGKGMARMLTKDELQEHQEGVTAAVEHLRAYKRASPNLPEVPAAPRG